MLTDSFVVPTYLGNIDHPRPGKYLRYSDDLIELYGTLYFRFSWRSYDESKIWEFKSDWWGDKSEARNFRLTEGDWDLMVQVLYEGLVPIFQIPCDDDDSSSYRVKSSLNSEFRVILKWLDEVDWHHLFEDDENGFCLQQIKVSPRFIKYLITHVQMAIPTDYLKDHYLLPTREIRLEDTFNLLRLQYPSEDSEYLPPSRILIEHEQKAERVLKEWERRSRPPIAD